MKTTLTKQESEYLFYCALCNGLTYISTYGIEIRSNSTDKENYQKARKSLEPKKGVCYEDVLIQMLRNGDPLYFYDIENEYHAVKLKTVHERVQNTPIRHLIQAIDETGDAITADVILQTVIFNEVIYG